MKYLAFLTIFLMTLAGCKDAKKTEYKPVETTSKEGTGDKATTHPGKKKIERECYLCHSPTASEASMLAPPMVAVKKHYLYATTTKKQFIEAMVDWINDPKIEKSKMPGALKRFGIMPYQPYPEETIVQIAEYMYENEIPKPEWFDDHFQKEHKNGKGNGKGMKGDRQEIAQSIYGNQGLGYAKSAKSALGKNLMKAIQERGTGGAVEFCNLQALKLTDSISLMNNAIIKRVTDKPRNMANSANSEELEYIASFKKQLAAGLKIEPIVKTHKGEVNVYYPIVTNAMCLQCHGKPVEQIKPSTMAVLQKLYPDDKAIGYSANEVRGIWSVVFNENK